MEQWGASDEPQDEQRRGGAEKTLLVIGDSLTFYGQDEVLGLDHPDIWASRAAAHLTERTGEPWRGMTISHGGWTMFDVIKVLQGDARLREAIAAADVVLLQSCGKDGVLSPFPRPVRAVIGRIPKPHRGNLVRWVKPRLARVTSRQFQMTRPGLFDRCYRQGFATVRSLNPTALVLGATPGKPYGPQTILTFPADDLAAHPVEVRRLAGELGIPLVDIRREVDAWHEPAVDGPDWLHWPPALHDRVGRATAEVVTAALGVRAPADVAVGS
jgi:hypothetical protein